MKPHWGHGDRLEGGHHGGVPHCCGDTGTQRGDMGQVEGGPSGRGDRGGATLGTWSQTGDSGVGVPTGG